MYSGQFEKVQLPIGTFGWWTVVGAGVLDFSAVPFTPPQAARAADSSAALPERPTNRRRVSASDAKSSASGSCGIGLLLGDDERVVRVPCQLHFAADRQRLGLGA